MASGESHVQQVKEEAACPLITQTSSLPFALTSTNGNGFGSSAFLNKNAPLACFASADKNNWFTALTKS